MSPRRKVAGSSFSNAMMSDARTDIWRVMRAISALMRPEVASSSSDAGVPPGKK